jgi:hypothetical protein
MNTIDRVRIRALCGALAAALWLGLAHPAGAWSQPQWVRQLGTARHDGAQGIATDGNGDVYIAGVTFGSLNEPNQGGGDAFIAKYSAAGAVLWKRQLGTPGSEGAMGIATDGKGFVYIAGETTGSLGGPNQGYEDAFIAKYSAAGALIWKRQFGSPDDDTASGVATDDKGNVYISGYTLTYGPSGDTVQAWVAKYSAAGALLWQRQLPRARANLNLADGVATDRDGNAYVIGHEGLDSAWLAKYSEAAVLLWQKELGSLDSYILPGGVATGNKGDVYISGTTGGDLGGPSQGGNDASIAKYSAAGDLLWKRQLGTPTDDRATGVATDDKGDVYITGTTGGALAGRNQGADDAWLAKYSASGFLLWKRQLGTPTTDFAWGIATDHDGDIYITGFTDGSLGGPNEGSNDAWIAKYSQRR